MVNKKTWEEFRESGLFWWINNALHVFGWAIVFELDENEEILSVYPARVKFRGFSSEINSEGFIKVSKYISENHQSILKESME